MMANNKQNEFAQWLALHNAADNARIAAFVMGKSNLPGPRANLTFAAEFADYFHQPDVDRCLWLMVMQWADSSLNQTQDNDPREYLPFCAIQALAGHFAFCDQPEQLMAILKSAMSDPRWRIKESAAIAFQIIGEYDFAVLKNYFNQWIDNATLLEQRAMLAALAHPPILKSAANAKFALAIADNIMLKTTKLTAQQRKSEAFKVLKKGLDYCLSVFVSALPKQGFELFDKYAALDDKAIKSILTSNLSKARIKNNYPAEVLKLTENCLK